MGTEKGILSRELEGKLAAKLDELIVFKNGILEALDGTAFRILITGVDDNAADKIPEPYKTQIRDILNEILINTDYESASQKAADLYHLLVTIPGLDDELERQIFIQVFMMVAHLLASIGVK